jgi:hypothetical protein
MDGEKSVKYTDWKCKRFDGDNWPIAVAMNISSDLRTNTPSKTLWPIRDLGDPDVSSSSYALLTCRSVESEPTHQCRPFCSKVNQCHSATYLYFKSRMYTSKHHHTTSVKSLPVLLVNSKSPSGEPTTPGVQSSTPTNFVTHIPLPISSSYSWLSCEYRMSNHTTLWEFHHLNIA